MSKVISPKKFLSQKYGKIDTKDEQGTINGAFWITVQKNLEEYAKLCVIAELKEHIEHPNKPGYRRHDILNRIKELEDE